MTHVFTPPLADPKPMEGMACIAFVYDHLQNALNLEAAQTWEVGKKRLWKLLKIQKLIREGQNRNETVLILGLADCEGAVDQQPALVLPDTCSFDTLLQAHSFAAHHELRVRVINMNERALRTTRAHPSCETQRSGLTNLALSRGACPLVRQQDPHLLLLAECRLGPPEPESPHPFPRKGRSNGELR